MITDNIDYDNLKKRGFLKQRHKGFFVLRLKMPFGVFKAGHLEKLIQISRTHARGLLHTTTRQGIEIPYIKFEEIPLVEKEIREAGIETGTSGPRLRTTTCCPGNNWCKSGLINTFTLYKRIEDELDIRCGMDLPHKFKIAVSGCPNSCVRPQQSEIGIHGALDTSVPEKQIRYTVYLGGCGGRTPHMGFKLERNYTEDEVVGIIERVVAFYKKYAKPRQRLALLIAEIGRENFLKEIGL